MPTLTYGCESWPMLEADNGNEIFEESARQNKKRYNQKPNDMDGFRNGATSKYN